MNSPYRFSPLPPLPPQLLPGFAASANKILPASSTANNKKSNGFQNAAFDSSYSPLSDDECYLGRCGLSTNRAFLLPSIHNCHRHPSSSFCDDYEIDDEDDYQTNKNDVNNDEEKNEKEEDVVVDSREVCRNAAASVFDSSTSQIPRHHSHPNYHHFNSIQQQNLQNNNISTNTNSSLSSLSLAHPFDISCPSSSIDTSRIIHSSYYNKKYEDGLHIYRGNGGGGGGDGNRVIISPDNNPLPHPPRSRQYRNGCFESVEGLSSSDNPSTSLPHLSYTSFTHTPTTTPPTHMTSNQQEDERIGTMMSMFPSWKTCCSSEQQPFHSMSPPPPPPPPSPSDSFHTPGTSKNTSSAIMMSSCLSSSSSSSSSHDRNDFKTTVVSSTLSVTPSSSSTSQGGGGMESNNDIRTRLMSCSNKRGGFVVIPPPSSSSHYHDIEGGGGRGTEVELSNPSFDNHGEAINISGNSFERNKSHHASYHQQNTLSSSSSLFSSSSSSSFLKFSIPIINVDPPPTPAPPPPSQTSKMLENSFSQSMLVGRCSKTNTKGNFTNGDYNSKHRRSYFDAHSHCCRDVRHNSSSCGGPPPPPQLCCLHICGDAATTDWMFSSPSPVPSLPPPPPPVPSSSSSLNSSSFTPPANVKTMSLTLPIKCRRSFYSNSHSIIVNPHWNPNWDQENHRVYRRSSEPPTNLHGGIDSGSGGSVSSFSLAYKGGGDSEAAAVADAADVSHDASSSSLSSIATSTPQNIRLDGQQQQSRRFTSSSSSGVGVLVNSSMLMESRNSGGGVLKSSSSSSLSSSSSYTLDCISEKCCPPSFSGSSSSSSSSSTICDDDGCRSIVPIKRNVISSSSTSTSTIDTSPLYIKTAESSCRLDGGGDWRKRRRRGVDASTSPSQRLLRKPQPHYSSTNPHPLPLHRFESSASFVTVNSVSPMTTGCHTRVITEESSSSPQRNQQPRRDIITTTPPNSSTTGAATTTPLALLHRRGEDTISPTPFSSYMSPNISSSTDGCLRRCDSRHRHHRCILHTAPSLRNDNVAESLGCLRSNISKDNDRTNSSAVIARTAVTSVSSPNSYSSLSFCNNRMIANFPSYSSPTDLKGGNLTQTLPHSSSTSFRSLSSRHSLATSQTKSLHSCNANIQRNDAALELTFDGRRSSNTPPPQSHSRSNRHNHSTTSTTFPQSDAFQKSLGRSSIVTPSHQSSLGDKSSSLTFAEENSSSPLQSSLIPSVSASGGVAYSSGVLMTSSATPTPRQRRTSGGPQGIMKKPPMKLIILEDECDDSTAGGRGSGGGVGDMGSRGMAAAAVADFRSIKGEVGRESRSNSGRGRNNGMFFSIAENPRKSSSQQKRIPRNHPYDRRRLICLKTNDDGEGPPRNSSYSRSRHSSSSSPRSHASGGGGGGSATCVSAVSLRSVSSRASSGSTGSRVSNYSGVGSDISNASTATSLPLPSIGEDKLRAARLQKLRVADARRQKQQAYSTFYSNDNNVISSSRQTTKASSSSSIDEVKLKGNERLEEEEESSFYDVYEQEGKELYVVEDGGGSQKTNIRVYDPRYVDDDNQCDIIFNNDELKESDHHHHLEMNRRKFSSNSHPNYKNRLVERYSNCSVPPSLSSRAPKMEKPEASTTTAVFYRNTPTPSPPPHRYPITFETYSNGSSSMNVSSTRGKLHNNSKNKTQQKISSSSSPFSSLPSLSDAIENKQQMCTYNVCRHTHLMERPMSHESTQNRSSRVAENYWNSSKLENSSEIAGDMKMATMASTSTKTSTAATTTAVMTNTMSRFKKTKVRDSNTSSSSGGLGGGGGEKSGKENVLKMKVENNKEEEENEEEEDVPCVIKILEKCACSYCAHLWKNSSDESKHIWFQVITWSSIGCIVLIVVILLVGFVGSMTFR